MLNNCILAGDVLQIPESCHEPEKLAFKGRVRHHKSKIDKYITNI